jgi:hypothetical protein
MRLILPLPGNETFARHLAEAGGWELGAIETRRFPDGETYVRVLSDVADRPVDLVCTLARPDDGFLRLAFAADAARALGASEVTLVAPYLSYMRQDRRFQPGEAVTSSSFARLVSSTFDRLVTVDPHLHRYPALSALYTIPTETLHAAPLLADWIAAEVEGGRGIGPALEALDVLAVLRGAPDAPDDLRRRAAALAGAALEIGGKVAKGEGAAAAFETIADGQAWKKFQAICEAQGGMRTPPKAANVHPLIAPHAGRIVYINNRKLARLAKLAGAPEAKAAGVFMNVRLGAEIDKGQGMLDIHAETTGELAYTLDYAARSPDIIEVEPSS